MAYASVCRFGELGFTELPSALCLFTRRTGSAAVFILVHVNDLGILSSSRQVLEANCTSCARRTA
jgi:hypothetical protein